MTSETDSGRDPVEVLAESFQARLRRGERPSLEEYAARCPGRADEIRALFPAMVEMEQLRPGGLAGGRPDRFRRPRWPLHRRADCRTIPSGWATTRSFGSSARGAWGSFTRPSTSRSRTGWH